MSGKGKRKFTFRGKSALLSEFEIKVLKACMKINEGQTSTYQKIAKEIGKPKAARAVGNALAKNQFAPLIPCHRVVRSDGSPGGYSGRGGQAGKKKLLTGEKAHFGFPRNNGVSP